MQKEQCKSHIKAMLIAKDFAITYVDDCKT